MTFQILSASTKKCIGLCTIVSEKTIDSLTESSIESVSVVSNTEASINLASGERVHIKGTVSLAFVSLSESGERKIETIGTLITENTEKSALRFQYVAKASKSERNRGLETEVAHKQGARPNSADDTGKFPDHDHRATGGNNHPTVKPLKLMQYLITLITPPNGIVLDPFMGSGTTGVAAKNLNFNFIGIEMNSDYIAIAEKRINA